MMKKFEKLSRAEQEKVELGYHGMQPEEFDDLMASTANSSRLLEAIADVEHDHNILMPDHEQSK